MIYKKKDFAACQFNPLVEQPLLDEYPKLHEIILPEWSDDPFVDQLVRYAIMVYDPKSILVPNERDLNHRKGVAAELAGFNLEDEEYMSKLYRCEHPFIADLIVKYLTRFGKSKEWAALCAFEYAFWESIKMIMEPINGSNNKDKLDAVQKKAAVKEELDKDIKRFDQYLKSFLGEDNELVDKSRRRITPELITGK